MRRCQCCGRLSDCAQGHWTAEINHIGWTSVRQRQHRHDPQHRWNDTQRFNGSRIEIERAGGVYRLRADTRAKMKSGTGGVKVLMLKRNPRDQKCARMAV